MKSFSFVLITKDELFRQTFEETFSEESTVISFESVPTLIPRFAQVIFCEDQFFHDVKNKEVTGSVVRLQFFEDEGSLSSDSLTYYVSKKADYKAVCEKISKIITTPQFFKSHVFTPKSISNISAVEVLVSEKMVMPKVKVTSSNLAKEVPVVHNFKKSKRSVLFRPKTSFYLAIFLLWVFVLPFASFGVATVSGAAAFYEAKALRIRSTQFFLSSSALFSSFAFKSGITLSSLPALGSVYKTVSDLSALEYQAVILFKEGITIVDPFLKNFDFALLQNKLPEIREFNRNALNIIAQARTSPFLESKLNSINLKQNISLLSLALNALEHSGSIFTPNSNLLVLLQNNMELRPTGGFIGSFALVPLSGDNMMDYKIYDVYDADGQLVGHIEPPMPIQKYLGEASWKMRDSNWDPDFSSSGRRAIWFLDKTLNKEAIGVVAINLEVLRSILGVVGPVEIPDYSDTIDSTNFYQKIQSEVHKNFFPGTRKKSNYLTAVSNGVLNKVQNEKGSWSSILKVLFSELESKNIEVYVNDSSLQKQVEEAGIGGTLSPNTIGFVESNVGVNKANQFISREESVTYKKGPDTILTQTLVLTNSAKDKNDETRYRVYIRSLAPSSFDISTLKIFEEGIERLAKAEVTDIDGRREAGLFLELRAGARATITYEWKQEKGDSYSEFLFWKQPGVSPFPLFASLSLTGGGRRQYNTQVTKDIILKL